MDSIATDDRMLATLSLESESDGAVALSTVADTIVGSGTRLSRQVEVAVAVERLVEQGLVRREATPDADLLSLTDEGRARASEIVDRLADQRIELVDGDDRRELTIGEAADELGQSPVSIATGCTDEGVYYRQNQVETDGFVDRSDEQRQFEAVLDRVGRTGDGETIRLVGPGGSGKTTLLDELVETTPAGVTVSRTSSAPAETEPYRPVRDLLDQIGTDDLLSTPAFRVDDAESFEAQQTGLFTEMIERLTPETGPRVLVFDDVNHAGAGTRAFLGSLCRQLDDRPLVVVLVHRPGTLPEGAPIHPTAAFEETRIEVTGLDRDGTRRLIEQVLGRRGVPAAFVDAIYERTGGTPLFVETTVETLLETDQLDAQFRWYPSDPGEFDLPAEVTETIQRQAAALEADVRGVLEWVAVAGGFVPRSLVQRAADYAPERVATVFDTVTRMGLLRHETRDGELHVAFRNEVFADALADRLSPSERRDRHGTVARLLEERIGEQDTDHQRDVDRVATVAYHYEQGGDHASAIEWYDDAADRATDVYAHETAVEYYYRVIDLARDIDDTERVLSANERLAEIYITTGEYDQAERHVQFVRERTGADDTDRRQRLALLRARIHKAQGEYDDAIEVSTAAPDGTESVVACRLLGVLANAHQGQSNYDQARETAERQRELARRLDESGLEADAAHALGGIAREQGVYEQAREHYEEGLAISEEIGDRKRKASSLTGLGGVNWRRGNMEQAEAYFEESLSINRASGFTSGEASALHNLGLIAAGQGEYDRASAYLTDGLEISEAIGKTSTIQGLRLKLGFVAEKRGRYEAAGRHYEQALALARRMGARRDEAIALVNRGYAAMMQGRYDRARERYEESLAISEEIGDLDGEAHNLTLLGDLSRRRGAAETARKYYDRALALAEEADLTRREAMSHRGLCMLARQDGDYDRASQHFEQALRMSTDANKRSDVVMVRLEGAALALARGDLATARERAETARDSCETLGQPVWTGRAQRLLGRIAVEAGESETAREQFAAAAETFEEIGVWPDTLETLELLVDLHREQGDEEAAERRLEQALAVCTDAPVAAVEAHGEWVDDQSAAAGAET